jgi:periplasmic copper chaperone A
MYAAYKRFVLAATATFCAIVATVLTMLVIFSTVRAHEGGPHVRVAHLAPTAPAVDVYVNGTRAVAGLTYPTVTAYLPLEGYQFEVVIVPAGGDPKTASVTPEPVMLTFQEGDSGYYTVAAVGALADKSFAVIMLPADNPSKKAAVAKASAQQESLSISNAFARPTAAGGHDHGGHGGLSGTPNMAITSVSAAYMTITNSADKADRLVKAESDVAGLVELHETVIVNDIAQMVLQESGIEIPAMGKAELKPGGFHIMLLQLKKELIEGDMITLKLIFESGLVIDMQVPVLRN